MPSIVSCCSAHCAGHKYAAEEASLVGNTCLYGATGGRLFVNGRAGERFAVRNSMAQVHFGFC